MLIEFSVENYRSFKDKATLSMVPYPSYHEHEDTHIHQTGGTKVPGLLTAAVMYGKNGSGKTNFLRAMEELLFLFQQPDQFISTRLKGLKPFAPWTADKPVTFDIVFSTNQTIYDYTLSVLNGIVHEEKLEKRENVKGSRASLLFHRKPSRAYKFGSKMGGQRRLITLTRPDNLFLKVLEAFNNQQIEEPLAWMRSVAPPMVRRPKSFIAEAKLTVDWLTNPRYSVPRKEEAYHKVLAILHAADLGIDSLHSTQVDLDMPIPDDGFAMMYSTLTDKIYIKYEDQYQRWCVAFRHKSENADTPIEMDISEESEGTQNLFALAGRLDVVLMLGSTVILDESWLNLHPLLLREVVNLFNDPVTNPKGAQLIFNTHDVTLLDQELYRRDQIWFVDKNDSGASELYPLNEFSPKQIDPLMNRYLAGFYDAVPNVYYRDMVGDKEPDEE